MGWGERPHETLRKASIEADRLQGVIDELRTDIKTLCDWIHIVNSGVEPPNERTAKVGDVVNKYRDKAMGRIKGLELRYDSQGILEIVQWETKTCYSVARWNGNNLMFVGTRPLEVDTSAFWQLVKQGYEQLKREADGQ